MSIAHNITIFCCDSVYIRWKLYGLELPFGCGQCHNSFPVCLTSPPYSKKSELGGVVLLIITGIGFTAQGKLRILVVILLIVIGYLDGTRSFLPAQKWALYRALCSPAFTEYLSYHSRPVYSNTIIAAMDNDVAMTNSCSFYRCLIPTLWSVIESIKLKALFLFTIMVCYLFISIGSSTFPLIKIRI